MGNKRPRAAAAIALLLLAAIVALLAVGQHRLRALLAPGSATAPHGGTSDAQCEGCHEREDERLFAIAKTTAGHRAHASGPGRTGCLSCHDERGQAKSPDACVKCHGTASVHKTAIEGAAKADDCITCHAFTTRTGEHGLAESTVDACGRCHGKDAPAAKGGSGGAALARAVVAKEVLHGEVDCKLCHTPTGGSHAGSRADECARCHSINVGRDTVLAGLSVNVGRDSALAGASVNMGRDSAFAGPSVKSPRSSAGEPAGHQRCVGCHAPHAPQRDAITSCATCHPQQALTRAAGERSTALQHDSCHTCHLPHTWVAERAGCVKCHDDKSQMLLATAPKAHARCQQCHAPHSPPPTAATCLGCHKPMVPAAAAAPAKHAVCVSCHAPHGAAKEALGACVRCHETQRAALFADRPAAHRRGGCLSCHTQHGDPRTGAAACRGCHQSQANLARTARPEAHQRCDGCHKPHTFAITDSISACSRCHENAAAAGGSHHGDCAKCHTPHGPPRVKQEACSNCHRDVDHKKIATQHPDGCAGCHQPHRTAAAATARCGSCHTKNAAVATLWPESAHRSSCTSCHQPHDARKAPRCEGCHTSEARAFAGDTKHRCVGCHAPHTAPPASAPDRWWSRCDGCHRAEAAGVRARGKTHGTCSSCHASHGAAVRTTIKGCRSCHKSIDTQAAHATAKHHEDCNACHSPHKSVTIEREACLSCHRDKTNHKPDAPRCQACHLFK